MGKPSRDLAAEFTCAQCGARAMRVVVSSGRQPIGPSGIRPGAPGILAECGTFNLFTALSELEDAGERARRAVAEGDASTLCSVDSELVPFWCRTCAAAYCADHWVTWDVYDPDLPSWFEETRGRCPAGHERRIFD